MSRAIRGTAATQIALMGQSNAVGISGATGPVVAPGELWVSGVQVTGYATQATSVESLLSPNRRVTKYAISSTGIESWLDTHLDAAFGHAATAGIVPSVTIWIQGEADATDSERAALYPTRWATLTGRVEAEWGPQTWLIGALSTLPSGTYPHMSEINAVFDGFAASHADAEVIATAGFEKQGDLVHYTRRGADAFARACRDALVRRGF
jgi:hypothetical protein